MRTLFAGLLLWGTVAGCSRPIEAPSQSAPPESATESAPGEAASAPVEEDGQFGLGDRAPEFANLVGVDDQAHALADFADAKAVAVVFTCNHCPVAIAYEDRLMALHKDYADQDVQLVAINVNNAEADKLPAMKERAEESGFDFPYLYDPTQQTGRDYGATVTPHVFLLDGDRNLAYVGAIDDSMDDPEGAEPLLRNAIDAVLAGEVPEIAETKPIGCGIPYE